MHVKDLLRIGRLPANAKSMHRKSRFCTPKPLYNSKFIKQIKRKNNKLHEYKKSLLKVYNYLYKNCDKMTHAINTEASRWYVKHARRCGGHGRLPLHCEHMRSLLACYLSRVRYPVILDYHLIDFHIFGMKMFRKSISS